MDEQYRIVSVVRPDDAMWEVIGGGIHEHNTQQAGGSQGKMLCLALTAPDGQVAGGLIGETHWGWLYINLLFVKEELRGQGYGHRLLTLAEEEARQHGATHSYLDTFSFQAPEFYRKQGYEVYGTLEDFPPGHRRYWMRKEL